MASLFKLLAWRSRAQASPMPHIRKLKAGRNNVQSQFLNRLPDIAMGVSEQHLEEALKRIFQYGQGGGIPRRSAHVLQMICEEHAELKSVLYLTYSEAQSLQNKCATPILKQVKNDVTIYRYEGEQYLDEALKWIFHYGQGGRIPRRSAPVLQMTFEEDQIHRAGPLFVREKVISKTLTVHHVPAQDKVADFLSSRLEQLKSKLRVFDCYDLVNHPMFENI